VPPSQSGRVRPARKRQASVEPVTVESLVKGFGSGDWKRCVLRDSTRGELRVDLAHRRVWVWDGALGQMQGQRYWVARTFEDARASAVWRTNVPGNSTLSISSAWSVDVEEMRP
ncbi:MAG: hypothetical protein ABSC06_28515, partial [Rhodopila sp.]